MDEKKDWFVGHYRDALDASRAEVAALTRERDALRAVLEAATELLDTQDRPHLSDDSHKRNVRDALRAAIAAARTPTP